MGAVHSFCEGASMASMAADPTAPTPKRTSPPPEFEQLNREARFVLNPDLFDGFRLEVSKSLSPKFFATHSLWLGSQVLPGGSQYTFGTQLVNDPTVMVGRLDTSKRLDARLHHKLGEVEFKVNANLGTEPHSSHYMVDAVTSGRDYTGGLKIGTGGLVGFAYLQHITPRLAVGFDGIYMGKNKMSGTSFGVRYSNGEHVCTAQWAQLGQASMSYFRKLNERVSLATEFVYGMQTAESLASFGAEFTLRTCQVKLLLMSNGRIASHLTEQILPGVALILNAEADQPKYDYKFGFGLQIQG
eukprot:GILK01001530.1.p1 GENE.GILK01001530.1~~GILK01001530.1.p1  ORF type:complete len:300 (+),score=26.59 GILK01001530.1:37-936(+)